MKTSLHAERQSASAPQEGAASRPRIATADPLWGSPRMVAQRARIGTAFGAAAQLQVVDDEPLQARMGAVAQREGMEDEDDALLQGRFAEGAVQRVEGASAPAAGAAAAPVVNETGMPNPLKAGIEALSGMDMSEVRVHRNSDKPAQLQALAYAQGNDIHLGPGQEQHLPHEAWHVVQQRQGRVRPTLQMKGGVAINDDVGLEGEADLMGGRAAARVAQFMEGGNGQDLTPMGALKTGLPAQLKIGAGNHGAQVCAVHDRAPVGKAVWKASQKSYDIVGADGTVFATGVSPDDEDYTVAGLEQLKMDAGMLKDYHADLVPELEHLSAKAAEIYKMKGLNNRLLPCGHFELSTRKVDWTGLTAVMGESARPLAMFMGQFMELNGQLPYIFSSEEFRRGDWAVQVDINYYIDRKPEGGWGPHKDTEGSNLFVNLLFNNEESIPGTEFTNDTDSYGDRKGPDKYLPNDLQREIDGAKTRIKADHKDKANEQWIGGRLGSRAYVSFVDELVWHSTPIAGRRARSTFKEVSKLIRQGFEVGGDAWLVDIYQRIMTFVERHKPSSSVRLPTSNSAWLSLPAEEKKHIVDTIADQMMAMDGDMVNEGGVGDVVEDIVPTRVATRPRSKSQADMSEWSKLDDSNKEIPRSFFRTWVRVKKDGTTLPKSL